MSDALYESDFYAWTREQALALRARRPGANDIDYDRVAEEIQEMGSEVRHACESYVRLIIEHLFKLCSTRAVYPVEHWRSEVGTFRTNLDVRLTPSITNMLRSDLDRLHEEAAKRAVKGFRKTEPGAPVDTGLRWTWDQITGDAEDDPLDRDYPLPHG